MQTQSLTIVSAVEECRTDEHSSEQQQESSSCELISQKIFVYDEKLNKPMPVITSISKNLDIIFPLNLFIRTKLLMIELLNKTI